jgi:hypothetical protein
MHKYMTPTNIYVVVSCNGGITIHFLAKKDSEMLINAIFCKPLDKSRGTVPISSP